MPQGKPNILVIMSDDIGIWNISAYHRGMMGGQTPNIDRIASGGGALHRLLCSAVLHGWPCGLHYRPTPLPRRSAQGRHAGREAGLAGQRPHHRRIA